ncbi:MULTISPECIES: hypothetical protein [unclassified Rhodococcus (in: high G+C Gram-positive bacteria)]|uniref:hypothetical protein n=1 Tax=unclassified Rhodococcus (in: high G+C Gram-positive bacteria) TaxID=192944 RepID=UPI00096A5FDD|nr:MULTISPECIES: hypothetical protein [unclassified Rhodococcus (in: high G+C Gram-positive bacteria)]
MKTFPQTRVSFSASDIDCVISAADSGLVQHALSQALRIVLESGGSAPGVEPIQISEALELFAWIEMRTSGESGHFLTGEIPMVHSATAALIFSRDVLLATAGNIEAGVCRVPDQPDQSPTAHAGGYRDCASWVTDLINNQNNKAPDSAYLAGPY